ncbi:MAG: hypothetical protein ACE5EO_00845 [Candidatus Krumholzibacteriia bacterium]
MMNVKVFVIALVALVVVGASVASAQTPYVGVFFDRASWDPPPAGPPIIGDGTTETIIPPGVFGQIDSVYIVAYNFDCFVTGVEVQVDYSACLTWVADLDTQPVTFGTTPTGMSMGWALPQNGFSAINIATVLVQWICTDCTAMGVPVVVSGHPLFNPTNPQYTCFNIPQTFQAVGLTALICPAVPAEETTWGRVKSLYSQ